ncbi:sporulation integral membrane protein YtvI [Paenibacillus ginsengihumi]|uniref:sporulation integral membrane protein YtvI n=1 Tax=Paenibacillus ginsengihumi TaxID=431596 RepID=UPI00037CB288|nr:sporulation integral membrane protein YtvI [Paenibacillus ginsengihumi]
MLSFYRKYYKTAFDIALIVLTVYLFMLAFSYVYKIATPIFFAFVIFMIIEPFAKFLHRRGVNKSIASAISAVLFVLIILGVITMGGVIFTAQIMNLIGKLPDYTDLLEKQIALRSDELRSLIGSLPPLPEDVMAQIKTYLNGFAGKLTAWASSFLTGTLTAISSFSSFVVNFAIGLILAYFLSIEIDTWKRVADEKTPNTFKNAFYFLRDNVLKGIVTYIKAQAKLISLTFIVIFAALLALGVDNAFSIALLAGVLDVLPLLGVSTLFIPWIVYLFIVGKISLAVWLTVLLVVVIGTRQILEPKITGDSLGVSAFTMLAFMIISLSLFGVAGLILSPILIILIKALYMQGYLKRWIRMPEEEYERQRSDSPETPA